MHHVTTAFALSALLLLGACRGGISTPAKPEPKDEPKKDAPCAPEADRPIDPGSPCTQAQVRADIAHFEDEKVLERIAAARRVAAQREAALGPLFESLERHPSVRTRSMAAYTLGFMDDRRAVVPLARATKDPASEVRYESASALLRLGDDRGLAPLIAGLEDPDPVMRSRSVISLHGAVHETFGFEPDGDPIERSAAVARWKGWLQRRREAGP